MGTLEEVGSPLRADCCFFDKCIFHQPLSTAPREKEPLGEAGSWVSGLQVNPPHPAAAGEVCAPSLTHPRPGSSWEPRQVSPVPERVSLSITVRLSVVAQQNSDLKQPVQGVLWSSGG